MLWGTNCFVCAKAVAWSSTDEDGAEEEAKVEGWLVEPGRVIGPVQALCGRCLTADALLTSVIADRDKAHVIEVNVGDQADPLMIECMHCYPYPQHGRIRRVFCSRANGWVGGRMLPRAQTPDPDAPEPVQTSTGRDLLLSDDAI